MKKSIQLVALLVGMAFAPAVSAQSPNGPRRWIEARHTVVNRLLRAPAPPGQAAQRSTQVARILNGMIDLDELARRALEPNWEQRTPAERTEFIALLRQLIEHNYRENLDQTMNFAVTYEPEVIDAAASTAVVRTTARSRTDVRAAPITIEYRMRRRGADWSVYDLVTNNSSLVATYHDSYTRIIRDRGFPELLRRMRTRVDALRAGTTVAAQ